MRFFPVALTKVRTIGKVGEDELLARKKRRVALFFDKT
jgi:hypothetical protein